MKDFEDFEDQGFDDEEEFKRTFDHFFRKLIDSSTDQLIFIKLKSYIPVDLGLIINGIVYNKLHQN